jgi:hypothetical protein
LKRIYSADSALTAPDKFYTMHIDLPAGVDTLYHVAPPNNKTYTRSC